MTVQWIARRNPCIEWLESRRVMASDWQNTLLMRDVDGSQLVTFEDAMVVRNLLDHGGARSLSIRPSESTEPYCDVNGDGALTPLDVLWILNALAKYDAPLQISGKISEQSDPNQNGVVLQPIVVLEGISSSEVQIEGRVDGQTEPLSTLAGVDGRYTLELSLPKGMHTIRLTAVDSLGRSESHDLVVRSGDLTQDWNRALLDEVRTWTTLSDDPTPGRVVTSPPPLVARNLAMVSTAIFDAGNAVDPQYQGYWYRGAARPDASSQAAMATAGYQVARGIYDSPEALERWEATYRESMAAVPEGDAKERGVALGADIAAMTLAGRYKDLAVAAEDSYVASHSIGGWDRTAPGYLPPLLPDWGNADPFVLSSIDAYLPEPPPDLSSEAYAEAVDEVMRLGSLEGSDRTEDQTQIARFWADGGGTITPPGHWNQIASDFILSRNASPTFPSPLENARVFSLLNLALADAGMVAWDAKFRFDLWRPIDAIRQASSDDNPDTIPVANWTPLLTTPNFPTYTSGHSTFSGAASQVLASLFGDSQNLVVFKDTQMGSDQQPQVPNGKDARTFGSFSSAAEEAGISRIYGGIHFGFDNTGGLSAGRSVGLAIVENSLAPLA